MNNKPMFETQSDYELPLLQLLYTLPNGGGKVSEILPRFEEKYRDQIPQKDHKNFESGGMRWEKNVQWCRYYLKERGFLNAPRRGIWQITDEGRRWVEENPKANRLPSFRREKPAQLNPIIKAITIENFRSIRHFTFDLEPLNVLLGYNAAGKSNIVEAISFLTDVIKGGVERAVQTKGRESFEDILYRKATTPVIRFELDLEAPSDDPNQSWSLTYLLALGPDPLTRQLQVREEYLGGEQIGADGQTSVFIDLKSGAYQLLDQSEAPGRYEQADFKRDRPALAQLTERRKYPLAQTIYQALSSIAVFHFDPEAIRAEARLVSEPHLGRRGENLAAVLDNFPRKKMDAILSEMSELVPQIVEIALRTGKPGHKLLTLFEDGQEQPFYPHQISDGTLRFLALLALAHGAIAGPLVVIEEPENGIHPTQLFQIVELLRGQAQRTQNQQKFIITTHADNLVSRLQPEEVRLLARDPVSGETNDITPPISVIEKRLAEFEGTLGELWFSGGLE